MTRPIKQDSLAKAGEEERPAVPHAGGQGPASVGAVRRKSADVSSELSAGRSGGIGPNATSSLASPGGSSEPSGTLFCRKCRVEFVEDIAGVAEKLRCAETDCNVLFWAGTMRTAWGHTYATVGIDPATVLPEHIFLKPTVGGGVYGTLDVPWEKVADGEIP